jgi:hypothetical protein
VETGKSNRSDKRVNGRLARLESKKFDCSCTRGSSSEFARRDYREIQGQEGYLVHSVHVGIKHWRADVVGGK